MTEIDTGETATEVVTVVELAAETGTLTAESLTQISQLTCLVHPLLTMMIQLLPRRSSLSPLRSF